MENGVPENGFSKPVVTEDSVRELLSRLYGIREARLTAFDSYDDVSYRVRTAAGEGTEGGQDLVLKVLNATVTSHGPGAVATQMAILDHLVRTFPGLRCQVPVANLQGDLLSLHMIPNLWPGKEKSVEALSAVRLYRYIPGKVMWDVSPLPSDLFFEAGRHLADLQLALQTFPGDTGPLRTKACVHPFCLDNVPALEDHLSLVREPARRQVVREVLTEFAAEVLPLHGQLRQGIVHHDFNENNVLVAPYIGSEGEAPTAFRVCGILDFDEMVHTCLVYEIAVSMMYLGQCSEQPLDAMGRLLAGFEAVAPLPPVERRLLRCLVAARYVQSLVLGLLTDQLHPGNGYVLNTQAKGWSILELVWSKSQAELTSLWDHIASSNNASTP